jgi:hypothetical protein
MTDTRRAAEGSCARFYWDALRWPAGAPLPDRIEVDDVDAALSRVWDFGGTVVCCGQGDDLGLTTVRFRDPAGRVVTLTRSPQTGRGLSPPPAA